ncbi:MAG: DNA mismatch repair endonuclease MutL [Chloroflexi bacterium]|nr:DNA mismatch repair endonuclease MutL [Chloroflexota bacterium]
MRPPIRVLPQEVASQIAAGEVVERPASVVKELVENALDAGATQVSVEVVEGGRRLIRVADDGCGIPEDEVELAFQRHATSKIADTFDLEAIGTLGFRGEALPSIAAVAQVTMVTRTQDAATGTYLRLAPASGGKVARERRACSSGTSVAVSDLFHHVPARLKFLRSPTTENGHIAHLVTQFVFAYPQVRFTLKVDGRTLIQSSGSGDLREAVAAAYQWEVAQSLLAIEKDPRQEDSRLPSGVVVSGLVSPPALSRGGRSYMSFFVNGRWVQSRMLSYALEEAYQGFLLSGKHPIAILLIGLPHREVDVNVHPTKAEVRFVHEREVFGAVNGAARRTLAILAPVPQMTRVAAPVPSGEGLPLALGSGEGVLVSPVISPPSSSLPVLRVLGQVANTYIIAEGPQGMYLIDQHTAHERVLYHKLRTQLAGRGVERQGLLEPLTVEVTSRQEELLQVHGELLFQYGFEVDHFGGRNYLVRSVPALLSVKGDTAQVLQRFLDELADEKEPGDWAQKVAISLACHTAVRAGDTLTLSEMRALVQDLEATDQPRTCPHGRPTMIYLSQSQLEREFGRR